jgi:hypothetical protein
VPLEGGRAACMERAVLDRFSQQARFRVGTHGRPPVPLELTLRGRSYEAGAFIRADYADSQVLSVPVRAPSTAVEATICIRNLGHRRVGLYGTADPDRHSRSRVLIDGRPVASGFGIVFLERRPVSILERLPVALERASTFRPGVSPVLLWPLLVLFAIGVPLAVLGAFAGALRSGAEDAGAGGAHGPEARAPR